ncbi:MAG: dihydrofolate reductase family protein [Hyphomonadaceae bacterium]
MSLDGFVDHDKFAPDPALFRYFTEQTRNTAGSIYGRGLYELMRYWDSDAWNQDDRAQDDLRAFAEAWRAMPKWIVSGSLKDVGPNATLIGDDFEAAIRKLKADVDGEIEVGGLKLAASLKLGLIDEYHLLHPVVLERGRIVLAGYQPSLQAGGERADWEGVPAGVCAGLAQPNAIW